MKKISILIPTYNEEENVSSLCREIIDIFQNQLKEYCYEIVFIDNQSKDNTRSKLLELCKDNRNIKAIFNAKNFGSFNSPYYGLLQTTGDCTILLYADFQDPVSLIVDFVQEWEEGFSIVIGIKVSSKENRLIYFIRSCYYKIIKRLSDVEQIEHFTGFGLYDRSFIEVLRKLKDPCPFLRGIVAELGSNRKELPYIQEKRRAGKSSNNLYRLYDAAMLSFTSYTKIGLRIATILGFIFSGVCLLISLGYVILKILYWDSFPLGMAPSLIGIFMLGSLQLIFIGLLGEYILSINIRMMNRPLVVEEKRINFEDVDNYH